MGNTYHITAKIKKHSSNSGMFITGTAVAVQGAYTYSGYADPGAAPETGSTTGSLAGMTLVFQEEFDSTPILRAAGGKWYPYFQYYGGSAQADGDAGFRWWGSEQQVYTTSAYPAAPHTPYSISASVITLRAQSKSSTWTTIQPYVSGMLSTDNGAWWDSSATRAARGGFEQKYGYWEIRCKIPKTQGVWPAFWLDGGIQSGIGGEQHGEIDIFECYNDNTIYQTIHDWWNPDPYEANYFSGSAGFNRTTTFHTYGLRWTSTEISWYVDGNKTHSASPTMVSRYAALCGPLYIACNLALGGYLGNPDGTTTWPIDFEIDYIRAYTIP